MWGTRRLAGGFARGVETAEANRVMRPERRFMSVVPNIACL
jgi:hypothetical protein